MLALKLILIATCACIAFQDFKDRMVYWILFPILGVCMGALFLMHIPVEEYLAMVGLNVLMVSLILSIVYLYTRRIAQKGFLNESFGLGDLLFFYAFALGYPTFTFTLLFVGAILFSLVVFLIMTKNRKTDTVPLAGLMGLFLIGVTIVSFIPNTPSLYLL